MSNIGKRFLHFHEEVLQTHGFYVCVRLATGRRFFHTHTAPAPGGGGVGARRGVAGSTPGIAHRCWARPQTCQSTADPRIPRSHSALRTASVHVGLCHARTHTRINSHPLLKRCAMETLMARRIKRLRRGREDGDRAQPQSVFS